MAKYDRLKVFQTMVETGLVPLFYHDDEEVACQVAQAVAAGGARLLEFTNRGPNALPVFRAVRAYLDREQLPLILGVGSIADEPTAALYIAEGANFIVGPMLNREIARLCNRRQIGYVPGCGTATEIADAQEMGAEIVKVFPGSTLGGPKFIKSVLAPMPWSRLMPTGGVDATVENIRGWIEAGAACVGMGSQLIRKDLLAASDYQGISENVSDVLGYIKDAKGG